MNNEQPDPKIVRLHCQLAEILEQVERCFTGPTKVTLLVRTPKLADGGVLIGNDDPEIAIAEIRRLSQKVAVSA